MGACLTSCGEKVYLTKCQGLRGYTWRCHLFHRLALIRETRNFGSTLIRDLESGCTR